MAHEIETMFYAGEVPWHGLGVGVAEAPTSADAIRLAGLDWEVAIGPLFGPDHLPLEDKFSVYRLSDMRVLGIASDRYVVLQNQEAFDFVDNLWQDGILRYESAGSLRGGRQIWLLARLTEDMRIAGDSYQRWLLLTSGHDTNTAVRVIPTMVRVVCNNTLQLALASGGGVRVEHSVGLHGRLATAAKILEITDQAARDLKERLEILSERTLNERQVEAVTEALFGSTPPEQPPSRELARFNDILSEEWKHSGYGDALAMFHAAAGYSDHARVYMGTPDIRAENRFMSVLYGRAASWKMQALSLLEQV